MSFLPETDNPEMVASHDVFKQHFGFLPRVFRAQMTRPDLIESQAKLIEALLFRKGSLTRIQKEFILLVVSARKSEQLFSGGAFPDLAIPGCKSRKVPTNRSRSSSGQSFGNGCGDA